MYYGKSSSRTTTVDAYTLFTGGSTKTPDFIVYYNIAITNVQKLLNHFEKRNEDIHKDIDISNISNKTYSQLAEFIWMAHDDRKNTNGYTIVEKDKRMIREMLNKLNSIRNYHSHVWHDNQGLEVSDELKAFIIEKYEKAKMAACEKYPDGIADFEYITSKKENEKFKLFNNKTGKQCITCEGRVFFLSFFLTSEQMNSFLQQRKGNKRADLPLFKLKRFAYTHYCHRDGASVLGFHHEESVLHDMDITEQRKIMQARQAYKLISYLHDYPEYLADNNGISLLIPDAETNLKKVTTIEELLLFIKDNSLLPECTFTIITFVPQSVPEENKIQQELVRTGTVLLNYRGIENFSFQISFDNLYKLVMVCLKYGSERAIKLKDNLTNLAEHRERLYNILIKGITDLQEADHLYLKDRKRQVLRGSRKLTEQGIAFFEDYERNGNTGKFYKKADAASIKLSNYIRPANKPWEPTTIEKYLEHEPEPIIIYAKDFIENTEQKFRAGNRFMFYAAKYLIDNNDSVAQDWYWEVERFEMRQNKPTDMRVKGTVASALPIPEESLVKVKVFQKQIKDGYRLSIENDHVTIGIPKKEGLPINETEQNNRHELFYQFSLGPRAMRYIMAYHVRNPNTGKKLNNFLADALKADFDNLHATAWSGDRKFKYLEDNYLPQYLKNDENECDVNILLLKAEKRLQYLINVKWKPALAQKHLLKRTEKNRLVMEAYKLFEWPKDEKGKEKFLRAHEYNYMSVCHYSLGEKKRKLGEKKSKFDYLFEDLFGLNARRPNIASGVLKLLNEANSLDELMEKAIANREKYISEQIAFIKTLPKKHRIEPLLKLCRKLSVPTPDNLEIRPNLQSDRAKTLQVLPFPVHPMLAMKYFEPKAYQTEFNGGSNPAANGIFAQIRKPEFTQGLYRPHYETDFLDNMLHTNNESVQKAYEKQKRKWIGAINNTLTEDAILWWIAKQYLQTNDSTAAMANALKANSKDGKLHVGSLYGQTVTIELKRRTDKYNTDDNGPEVHMNMMMHQLDDAMFATDKERLRRAALHYMRRNHEEKEHWADLMEKTEPLPEDKTPKPIPDGTADNPIPYETLRREMKMIALHGMRLGQYLLDLETQIINNKTKGMMPDAKQAFMMANSSKKPGWLHHVNFEKIIELSTIDTLLKPQLIQYRNKNFHNDIPIHGSYSWWARPDSEIGKVLGVQENLHAPKDKSGYIITSIE